MGWVNLHTAVVDFSRRCGGSGVTKHQEQGVVSPMRGVREGAGLITTTRYSRGTRGKGEVQGSKGAKGNWGIYM